MEAACECCKARREPPSTPRSRRRFQSALCTARRRRPSASPPAAAKSASDRREEYSAPRGDYLFCVWRQAVRRRARFSARRRWDSFSGQSIWSARPPAEFVDAANAHTLCLINRHCLFCSSQVRLVGPVSSPPSVVQPERRRERARAPRTRHPHSHPSARPWPKSPSKSPSSSRAASTYLNPNLILNCGSHSLAAIFSAAVSLIFPPFAPQVICV